MTAERALTAVAVSGGRDSLYALARLKEQGLSLLALHARMLPADLVPTGYEAMLERLAAACAVLDIPLHVADCTERFAEAVITPFIHAYAGGKTPNPCAVCNARIKFGLLLDIARELGASSLATGHYAHLVALPDGPALFTGGDAAKDQSYFLSLVSREQLAHALFPLASTTKTNVAPYLASRGLAVPIPGESQEICFVPEDNYRAFIQGRADRLGLALSGPGPVALPDGRIIGEHKGLWRYTEGQRKGLGIAWSEPLYVLAKNTAANTLLVGAAANRAGKTIMAGSVNYLVPPDQWPEEVLMRTRYRQTPKRGKAEHADGVLYLHEDTPDGPHAAGQLATIYTPDAAFQNRLRVLGGGIIL